MSRSAQTREPVQHARIDDVEAVEALSLKIDAAQTSEALSALIPQIKAASKGAQDAVRSVYTRRADELRRGSP
jgi:hypothetical protein